MPPLQRSTYAKRLVFLCCFVFLSVFTRTINKRIFSFPCFWRAPCWSLFKECYVLVYRSWPIVLQICTSSVQDSSSPRARGWSDNYMEFPQKKSSLWRKTACTRCEKALKNILLWASRLLNAYASETVNADRERCSKNESGAGEWYRMFPNFSIVLPKLRWLVGVIYYGQALKRE